MVRSVAVVRAARELASGLVERSRDRSIQRGFIRVGGYRVAAMLLGGGNAVAMARVLGPDKLGFSAIALSIMPMFVIAITFNADALLVRDFRARVADRWEVLLSVIFSRAVFALVWASAGGVALTALGSDYSSLWPWLALFLISQTLAPTWVLQALGRFDVIQRASFAQACVVSAALLAYIQSRPERGFDVAVLAVASSAGSVVGWLTVLKCVQRTPAGFAAILVRTGKMMKRSKWLLATGIAAYVYLTAEQPLLALMLSPFELGQYRAAAQVTNFIMPLLLLVPQMLYPYLVDEAARGRKQLWKAEWKAALGAAVFAVPSMIAIFVCVPPIFRLMFGAEFGPAALPCAILIASKLVVLIGTPFAWGLWADARDRGMFVISATIAALSLGLNFLAIPRIGMIGAACVNMLSECAMLLAASIYAYLVCCRERSRKSDDN